MGCYLSEEELEECCKDPCFCAVCLSNRTDVPVVDHCCAECAEPPVKISPEEKGKALDAMYFDINTIYTDYDEGRIEVGEAYDRMVKSVRLNVKESV